MVDFNEKIQQRREQLGLSDVEVAEKTGIGISAYGDLEAYGDEATTAVSLADLKRLCDVLDLELIEFLNIPRQQFGKRIYPKPRNVLIREMRQKKGLSEDELGDRVGFYVSAIISMESDPDFLELWCVEDILVLARILDIQIQLLLDS